MPSLAQRAEASRSRAPVDLRPLLPVVRAQGPRPLCVPFAVAAIHEAARSAQHGAGYQMLAIEPLWQHCVQAGHANHNGTTLQASANAVQHRGEPPEADWPYNSTLGAGTEPEPASATAAIWFSASLLHVPLAHDGIEDLIELCLSASLAVAIVIELTAEFEYPGPAGEIAVPALTSAVGDYHAVVAVGAATSADGSTRRLLIRNSWGTGWGAGGYGWLPLDYLVAFAGQASVLNPATLATI